MRSPKEIAIEAIKVQPQDYYREPFEPHPWVISAIIKARNEGILEGRRQVREDKYTPGSEIHGLF